MWDKGPTLFSECRYTVVPAPFTEKTILSSTALSGTFNENQLTINMRMYFCTFSSTPLTYMSLCLLVSLDWLLYSTFWNLEVQVLRLCVLCFFFLRLFWLLWIPYITIWILGSTFSFLLKRVLGFRCRPHWSAYASGECCHLASVKLPVPEQWVVLPLLMGNSVPLTKLLRHVQLFATPWTIAYQASLSMGFSRQE